ncbi:MAG: ATP synthase F1 subunit gamma [Oscillospiraceae bacterium]|jgi:F-type H+-transporting ATPase subunit gamma|nr:ATP synthase F1 subunit gamma [Oscillospiraceae bacterium]
MASANEIRHRIAAVEQTRKITGAMEMVSSNRMRRIMSHREYNRRYFDYIRRSMREILNSVEGITHPYLTARPEGRRAYIVITGDKGLCGSYNSAILALADQRLAEFPDATLITIGNIAEEYYRRRGRIPDLSMYGIVQDPTMKAARRISREIMRIYDEGLTDEVHMVFTASYDEMKNKPFECRILPIMDDDYLDIDDDEREETIYSPSPHAVLNELVPQYILGLLFGIIAQAYASEHYARMNAMHASTQNAGEMLKALTTQYNLARQSAITNELSEITGAAEILKGGGLI